MRDLIFAFYELVRSAVYVSEPSKLENDDAFNLFTRVLRDSINILERTVESLSEAFLDMVGMLMNVMFKFVQLFTGTVDIQKFVNDIVKLIKTLIVDDLAPILFSILMQIPGFDMICKFIFKPLVGPVNEVASVMCKVVKSVNSALSKLSIHVLDGICDFVCNIHIDPDICDGGKPNPFTNTYEPTVCVTDRGCGASSFCMVNGNETLCQYTEYKKANVLARAQGWDQPCQCHDFSDPRAYGFCNVATGFCQEGPSVFQEPLATCPSAGAMALIPPKLGELWEHQHSLCYVMPTWRCSSHAIQSYGGQPSWSHSNNNTMYAALMALTMCRWDLATSLDGAGTSMLEGPFLCSELCTPSVLHADNRLTQVSDTNCDLFLFLQTFYFPIDSQGGGE